MTTSTARKPIRKTAGKPSAQANSTAVRKTVAGSKGMQSAAIPDTKFLDEYVSRVVVPSDTKPLTEFDVFDYADTKKYNVLIEGPTGCAKTSAVLAYAAKIQRPFYAVPSNIGIEPSQLFGKFVPMPDGSVAWVDGPVTSIVRNGGVLLINEVNFIPDRVATVLFGLLDKRRQITLLDHQAEVIDAHDELLIIADMNPEYEGTRPLNKAFRNRFAVQLPWGYDPTVEKQLIKSAALLDMAGKLRVEQEQGSIDTPCSTNMLMEFERSFSDMGYDFSVSMFVSHFHADERGAVKLVVDTFADTIQDDLDVTKRKAREAAERKRAKEVAQYKKDLESMLDPVRKSKQRVIEIDELDENGEATGLKTWALYDDEWGVEGQEWVWDDDDADDEDEEYDDEDDDDDDLDDDDDDEDDA